jgi:hypothetical protein
MGESLKKNLLSSIEDLPEKKIKEVINFVNYLKLKEDDWFMVFVNKRGALAKADKKAGKKFSTLTQLQRIL